MKTPVPELMVVVPTEENREPNADSMDQPTTAPMTTAAIEENTALDRGLPVPQRTEPGVTMPEVEISTAIADPTVKTEKETAAASSAPPRIAPALREERNLPLQASVQKRPPVHRLKHRGLPLLLFLALLVSIGLGSGFLM